MMVQLIHPPTLLAAVEDDRKPWVLLWCFTALGLLELYSLFPGYNQERQMFWLSEQYISFQSWVDYASTRLAIIVLLFTLSWNVPRYQNELNILGWLAVGYLVDYFIIYNDPFAQIKVWGWWIPLSYTLFMLILGGVIVSVTFYKAWK
jgi:hypothetical protein